MGVIPTPPEVRFWRKVDRTAGPEQCWPWTASRKPNGYGQFGWSVERRSLYAHRVAWELTHGRPIPDGLTIDHLCRVRECCNPLHMETVTLEENFRRAVASWTHCPNGHEYAEGTYRMKAGRRNCLTCLTATMRRSGERVTEKDRARRGGVDTRCKLTDDQVRELRRRRAQGERVTALAVEFGISPKTADAIVNGRKRRAVV